MFGSWKRRLIPGILMTAAGIASIFYVNRLEQDWLNKLLAWVFITGVLGGPGFIAFGIRFFLYIAGIMGTLVLILVLPKPYSSILAALSLGGALVSGVLQDQKKKRTKPKRAGAGGKRASPAAGRSKAGTKRPPSLRFTARELALALNIASVAVFVFCLFLIDIRTYPYGMALCLALPPAGFAAYALKPGVYLYERKDESKTIRGSILLTLLLPCTAMLLRSNMDHNIIDWTPVWYDTLGLAVILTALFLLYSKEYKKRRSIAFAAALFILFYSYCAVVQVNCAFDQGEPARLAAVVEKMNVSHSSRSPDRYHVHVLMENETRDLTVGKKTYGQIAVGDVVDVEVRPGVLGIRHAYIKVSQTDQSTTR